MKGVLLRVGCDSTPTGGNWNAPVNLRSLEYVYIPIAGHEERYQHLGSCPTYGTFSSALGRLGVALPLHLTPSMKVHLDPDFTSLTFGEPYLRKTGKLSSRGLTLDRLNAGDFIVFFAGFRAIGHPRSSPLSYCLFGIFYVRSKTFVHDLPIDKRHSCAHGRRKGAEKDLVIWGDPKRSGRFQKAIPIGEYRNRAYRVTKELLHKWGDLTVKDGYLQRSAIPPFFLDPHKFISWIGRQGQTLPLLQSNC